MVAVSLNPQDPVKSHAILEHGALLEFLTETVANTRCLLFLRVFSARSPEWDQSKEAPWKRYCPHRSLRRKGLSC